MRIFPLLLLVALGAPAAQAQQLEQVQIIAAIPPFSCPAGGEVSPPNQVLFLENIAAPAILPNPAYITKVVFWNQSLPLPAGVSGDISVAIDTGRLYETGAGFPVAQSVEPKYLKSLVAWELFPGGSQQKERDFNPPIAYRAGQDGIIFAPECLGSVTLAPYVAFYIQATGDIAPVTPVPAGATAVFARSLNMASIGNPGYSLRNVVPGIAEGGTQVRVRVTSKGTATVAQHASVGVRSGGGSGTVATPVELTFSGASGFSLAANHSRYSDWVALGTAAGQDLLVTISLFNPSNSWSLDNFSGAGAYGSLTDSWNSAALLGTIITQPNTTHIIDQVQVK